MSIVTRAVTHRSTGLARRRDDVSGVLPAGFTGLNGLKGLIGLTGLMGLIGLIRLA